METPYLDLQEGEFVHEHPVHPNFLSYPYSYITSQLLKVMQPHELTQIKLNKDTRRTLLRLSNLLCLACAGFWNDEDVAGVTGSFGVSCMFY